MTHRIDMIRDLLLHVEKHSADAWIDLWIAGYEEEAVFDCVRLLERLGYFDTVTVSVGDREFWQSVSFTSQGKRLLAAAHSQATWTRAKQNATALAPFLESLANACLDDKSD